MAYLQNINNGESGLSARTKINNGFNNINTVDFQNSVLSRYNATGGLPIATAGDRYLSTATANGWTIDNIYEYNGSSWIEIVALPMMLIGIDDEEVYYFYNGTAWIKKNTDTFLLDRTNHTGTQAISTIDNLQTTLNAKEPANANIQNHISTTTGNPHSVTKSEVGLGNADNTTDLNKPISTATQTALDGKENSFTKNTAFNKNFGTSAGTVAQGNDARILDSFQKSSNTLDNISAGLTNQHFTNTDKFKLDGIEANATADQTKADIDALAINAGQVDGLEASQFLRSDVADTATGELTFSGTVNLNGTTNINPNGQDVIFNTDGARTLINFQRSASQRCLLQHDTDQDTLKFVFTNKTGGLLYSDGGIKATGSPGIFAGEGFTTGNNRVRLVTDPNNNISFLDYGTGELHIRNDNYVKTMTFSTDGNKVGIRNEDPEYRLDLANKANDDAYNEYIRLGASNTADSESGGIIWKPAFNTYTKLSAGIHAVCEDNFFRTRLEFRTNATANNTTNATTKLTIKGNGNVGIGTITPKYRLDLSNNSYVSTQQTYMRFELSDLTDHESGGIIWLPIDSNYTDKPRASIVAVKDPGGWYRARLELRTVAGQNNVAATTTLSLDTSGNVSCEATTGALIVNRMTTTQRNALTAVNGMIIYNTSTNQFNFYENGSWVTK